MLVVVPAEDQRHQCPYSSDTQRAYVPSRKHQAGMARQRKITRTSCFTAPDSTHVGHPKVWSFAARAVTASDQQQGS
jgi:hypothetical protein